MPKNLKRTPAQKAVQKSRTAKNKVKKYQKLLAERPNDIHKKTWENQIKINQ